MATVLHSCSSPRQRHILNNTDCCLLNTGVHQQASSKTMYTTMPKYSRTSVAPPHSTSIHHSNVATNQYGAPMYVSLTAASGGGGAGGGGGGAMGLSSTINQQRPLSVSTVMQDSSVVACYGNYWTHQLPTTMLYRSGRHYSKRKSAVELLAESKSFYIRNDAIFDRLQQSNYRNATTSMTGSVKRGRRPDDGRYNPTYGEFEERHYGTAPHIHHTSGRTVAQQAQHMHHHHHQQQQQPQQHERHHVAHSGHALGGRHSVPANNNLLQNKLRMLLGTEAIKERDAGVGVSSNGGRNSLRKYDINGSRNELKPVGYEDGDNSSALRIPPPMYMAPPAYNNVYSHANECNSGDELLVLTENYRPISPPAEYAANTSQTNNERCRYNYQRSYSHSHEMGGNERAQYTNADYNINSHKSLPDLHTQISRHSPHSEILSCCSRGNRSIKSAGESSLNRDSGGSSGHYTHRSEPCYQRQREVAEREIQNSNTIKNGCNMVTRRDSGSSTQHSANSYCGYATPAAYPPPPPRMSMGDCADCRCKTDTLNYTDTSDYLLNFTTPEVPEAFQDDYTPPSPRIKELTPRYSSSSSQQHHSSQGYTSINHSQSSLVQSPGSAPSIEDISPPPIQFKRQRCIRFKNRSRLIQSRTINNECVSSGNGAITSVGAAGYQRTNEHDNVFFPKGFNTQSQEPDYQQHSRLAQPPERIHSADYANSVDMERETDTLCDLEKFFDRLGLNDETFHEIYSQPKRRHSAETESDNSSTVFFSDVSTVDSMRLPDSTETQSQTTQPYRPSEPPSIVERNARIIKWLCNCKKLQYA